MAPGSTDIRYVCLSDLHLGEEDSLLTHVPPEQTEADPTSSSPVLLELAACLKSLILSNPDQTSKPTLILNGDILELALTTDNLAVMAFERFLEGVMPPGGELFGKIIYIPGNHDHHLWESARETQYVLNYLAGTKPKDKLKIPWHATNIFMDEDPHPVPSFFLTKLVQRYDHLRDFTIYTAYPNFGLRRGSRAVIFHHGHFIESIYQFMTTLKNLIFPKLEDISRKAWDLEGENFAWIDFFWSTLGRSGEVGQDVEIIYEKMQSEKQFRKLLNTLAESLADKYAITGLGVWLDSQITKMIINGVVDKLVNRERTQSDQPLSPDAAKGLQEYLNFPLKLQLEKECREKHYFPREVTFVFGHTHKPYEEVKKFLAYLGEGVPIYNTGGWVVESVQPTYRHGGAMVLLNENLDAASLRFYNEAASPGDYRVEIKEVPLPGNPPSDFFLGLQGLIQPNQPPWSLFSQTVAGEVSLRARNLQDRINKGG
jgi:UDP-2,3-diacylglucosamine pyrophosphatase LpxH